MHNVLTAPADINLCAEHAKRVTIRLGDMRMARTFN